MQAGGQQAEAREAGSIRPWVNDAATFASIGLAADDGEEYVPHHRPFRCHLRADLDPDIA